MSATVYPTAAGPQLRHRPVVRRLLTAAVVLAVGVAVPSLLGVSVVGAVDPFQPAAQTVVAQLAKATGLYDGQPVLVHGMQAGTITAVMPRAGHVDVRMTVSGVALAPGARATVGLYSLVGERYVALGPVWSGRGPTLGPGAVIPLARTSVPPGISDILDQANHAIGGLDPAAVGRLVRELAAAVGNDGPQVAATTAALSDLARTVADQAGALGSSLTHLQAVTAALAAHDGQINSLTQSAAVVSQALLGQNGAFGTAITGLDNLLGQLSTTLGTNHANLAAASADLGTIGTILAAHAQGWAQIIDKLPYADYGFYNAISYANGHWFLRPQVTGTLFAPFVPTINSAGGPGSALGDHTVVPGINYSKSPVAQAIPQQVNLSGPTGPGPLLPSSVIGPVSIVGSGT